MTVVLETSIFYDVNQPPAEEDPVVVLSVEKMGMVMTSTAIFKDLAENKSTLSSLNLCVSVTMSNLSAWKLLLLIGMCSDTIKCSSCTVLNVVVGGGGGGVAAHIYNVTHSVANLR